MSNQPTNYPHTIPLDQYATFRYSLGSTQQRSLWAVSYLPEEQNNPLSIPEGNYTLEEIRDIPPEEMRPAERLCSLPTHEDIATVFAISSTGDKEYIWYEQTDAGTLENLLLVRNKITPEEVTGMVEQLCRGLRWLHEQQMAYHALNPRNIGFTGEGKLKLYAPERELRGANRTVIDEYIRQDESAFASIIWRCLTGEEPATTHERTPLHFLYPTMNTELMQHLEAAIDKTEQMPHMHEIYRLLAHEFVPRPVNLCASAHPQTHGTLPAEEPWRTSSPEQKSGYQRFFERGSIELSSSVDLNHDASPYGIKKAVADVIAKISQSFSRGKILWGIGGIICCTVAMILTYGVTESSHSPLAELRHENIHESSSAKSGMTPAPSHGSFARAEDEERSAIEDEPTLEGEDLVELLGTLLHKRQESFSQQNPQIQTYAIENSPQYLADMDLHKRDTQKELGRQEVKIAHIQKVDNSPKRIDVQADVISPSQSAELLTEEEKQRYGIKNMGENVQQTVRFTLLPDETTWKIYEAVPVNEE
ncbi:protein kinase [Rothia sp. P6271]|uniref:protein kinase n=1 Tax=Rothia sp. P6271 TaxID=3402659 RepID=UPI003ABEA426